jgi:hypothetical protein
LKYPAFEAATVLVPPAGMPFIAALPFWIGALMEQILTET